jgi:hypothetical protein
MRSRCGALLSSALTVNAKTLIARKRVTKIFKEVCMMVIDRDDIVVQQKNVRIYRGHSFSSRTERRYLSW